MTDTELAYAAGIVDGEGCVGIYLVKRQSLSALVRVTMTDHQIPEWLERSFGGRIRYEERPRPHRDIAIWTISGQEAAGFCSAIRPFLRGKHRQADLICELFSDERYSLNTASSYGGGRARLSDEQIALREDYAERSHALNARGATRACS